MKKTFFSTTLIGLILAVSSVSLQAQEAEFHRNEAWETSLKNARAQNKYILVDAYTDWCGWCKVMDKKTFTDPAVADKINTSFYPVKLEMEKEADGRKLSMKYHVNSFPTFLFFNPDGKLVYVSKGYEDASAYMQTLDKALRSGPDKYAGYNNTALEPGFPSFFIQSFDKSNKAKVDDKTVTDFIRSQQVKTSEVSWGVMWRFAGRTAVADVILENAKDLAGVYPKEDVEAVVANIIFSKAQEAAKKGDKEMFRQCLEMVDKYLSENKDEYKRSIQLNYYETQGNWQQYADVMNAAVKSRSTDGMEGQVNEVAWTLYEKCKDGKILSIAASWMETVVAAKPEYMYLDTYAALLYSLERYADAEIWAKKAIEAGNASGEDVKSTEDLLRMIRDKH